MSQSKLKETIEAFQQLVIETTDIQTESEFHIFKKKYIEFFQKHPKLLEFREYTNLVKFDKQGYPSCEKHGVMLCVNNQVSLYRCPTCNIGIDVENCFVFVEQELIVLREKKSQ